MTHDAAIPSEALLLDDHCCDGCECGCHGLPRDAPPEAEESLFAEDEGRQSKSALVVTTLSRRQSTIENARASNLKVCANCGHTWHRHHAFSDVRGSFVEHSCELWSTCYCKGWIPLDKSKLASVTSTTSDTSVG